MAGFWDVSLCSLVEVDRYLRGVHPDDRGSTSDNFCQTRSNMLDDRPDDGNNKYI